MSFIESSVSSLGRRVQSDRGWRWSGRGRAAQRRIVGGGVVTQTLLGAPHPHSGAVGTTLLGAGRATFSTPANTARAARRYAYCTRPVPGAPARPELTAPSERA
jgi:hypothetical protein